VFKGEHLMTLGIDYKVKLFKNNDQMVKIQIWDSSGDDRYQCVTNLCYRKVDAIIYVFSFDNYDSFRRLTELKSGVNYINPNPIEILVGNKSDVDYKEVSQSEIQQLLSKPEWMDVKYIECSAKNNVGVTRIFQEIAHQFRIKSLARSDANETESQDQHVDRSCCSCWG